MSDSTGDSGPNGNAPVDPLLHPAQAVIQVFGGIRPMAHKLGIRVIGEGVENEGQQQILLDSRCDFQQGYLFSHPLPEAEFLERFASA